MFQVVPDEHNVARIALQQLADLLDIVSQLAGHEVELGIWDKSEGRRRGQHPAGVGAQVHGGPICRSTASNTRSRARRSSSTLIVGPPMART